MRAIVPTAALLLAAVVIACVGVSCSTDRTLAPESPPPAESPTYLPPSSPENVLANLVTAHQSRDLDGYAACFSEAFVFVASPKDGLESRTLTRQDDLASTRRMFEHVERIEMTLTPGHVVPSDRPDYPPAEGYLQTLAVADITVTVPTSGGTHTLRVDDDPAYFIFEPSEQNGDVTYRIVRQEDRR